MPHEPITRRQLLKAMLAAGGGLSASAMLPSKWLKPVVKSGVLPVHAQTSVGRFIGNGGGILGEENGIFNLVNIYAYVMDAPPGLSHTDSVLSGESWGDVGAAKSESIPDIPVTMNYQVLHNSVGSPDPTLPRTVITDLSGAYFGSQSFVVSGDWSFRLVFTAPGCNPGYSLTFPADF
jgi:hypothetical protein